MLSVDEVRTKLDTCKPIYVYIVIAAILMIIAFVIGVMYGGLVSAFVTLLYNVVLTIICVIVLMVICHFGNKMDARVLGLGMGTLLAGLSILVYVIGIISTNYYSYRRYIV